ncbi:Hypothetical predicted protein, partial [Paramuricea clavata]
RSELASFLRNPCSCVKSISELGKGKHRGTDGLGTKYSVTAETSTAPNKAYILLGFERYHILKTKTLAQSIGIVTAQRSLNTTEGLAWKFKLLKQLFVLDKTDKGHTWTQVINSAQGDTEVKKLSEIEVDVK